MCSFVPGMINKLFFKLKLNIAIARDRKLANRALMIERYPIQVIVLFRGMLDLRWITA